MILYGDKPLTFSYGEAAAPILGYDKRIDMDTLTCWYDTRIEKGKNDLFIPEIVTCANTLIMQTVASQIKLYLIDLRTMSCLMRGFPWQPARIDALCDAWAELPYSVLVCDVLREKVEWYDANPGFRGIPVKQSKVEERKLGARDAN